MFVADLLVKEDFFSGSRLESPAGWHAKNLERRIEIVGGNSSHFAITSGKLCYFGTLERGSEPMGVLIGGYNSLFYP